MKTKQGLDARMLTRRENAKGRKIARGNQRDLLHFKENCYTRSKARYVKERHRFEEHCDDYDDAIDYNEQFMTEREIWYHRNRVWLEYISQLEGYDTYENKGLRYEVNI
jgi:hypothetical protein